jgi:hypothetical protein
LREVGKDKFYTFEVLTQVDPMRMQGLELFNAAAQTVSVQRSYSEFELLSDQLRSSFAYRKDSVRPGNTLHKNYARRILFFFQKKYVPKLPPTLFYLNDRRLEERRLALHRFLHQVASSELLRGEKWLAQFLQLDRRIDGLNY